MKNHFVNLRAVLVILMLSIFYYCKPVLIVVPTVTVLEATNITSNSATAGGAVTVDGGDQVTARGICWSPTNITPTISDSKTSDGIGIGSFSSSMSGLLQGTPYYFMAYAINSAGTAYSNAAWFKTLAVVPVLTTTDFSSVTANSFNGGGNITSDGGSPVTARGICWSINQNPTITDTKTSDGTGTGIFTSSVTGLAPGATYYAWAYATNSIGTGYGNQITIKTTTTPPVVTTTAISTSSITSTSAIGGGNVTSDGGVPVTARGVCWSTATGPTTANNKTTDATGTGVFSSSIIGLTPGWTYYVRAYATNSIGMGYGTEVSFSASTILSTITTTAISNITSTTATGGGIITSDGGGAVTARGVCWGITTGPTVSNSKTTDGTGTGTFTSSITGLSAGTIYYVRAYATNSAGTAYGNEVTFSALPVLPTISTNGFSNITASTATSGGNITSDGGAVTARGVCWGITTGPTVSNSKTTDGTGTGTFTSSITGLSAGTIYYVRSYATNSAGTVYGTEVTFTTKAIPAIITTTAISNIAATTSTGGGNVTSDGGATVTARGVCWGTTTGPTTANSKTTDATGTGTFTSSITGLTPGSTYYVRAYATNSVGTAYGNEVTFSALPVLPTISTNGFSNITASTATSGGNITTDGGSPVTARGVCWSASSNPTTANSKTTDGTGTGGFTSQIAGLTPGATYYIRAYATNSIGTAYGGQVTATTTAISPVKIRIAFPFNVTNVIFHLWDPYNRDFTMTKSGQNEFSTELSDINDRFLFNISYDIPDYLITNWWIGAGNSYTDTLIPNRFDPHGLKYGKIYINNTLIDNSYTIVNKDNNGLDISVRINTDNSITPLIDQNHIHLNIDDRIPPEAHHHSAYRNTMVPYANDIDICGWVIALTNNDIIDANKIDACKIEVDYVKIFGLRGNVLDTIAVNEYNTFSTSNDGGLYIRYPFFPEGFDKIHDPMPGTVSNGKLTFYPSQNISKVWHFWTPHFISPTGFNYDSYRMVCHLRITGSALVQAGIDFLDVNNKRHELGVSDWYFDNNGVWQDIIFDTNQIRK